MPRGGGVRVKRSESAASAAHRAATTWLRRSWDLEQRMNDRLPRGGTSQHSERLTNVRSRLGDGVAIGAHHESLRSMLLGDARALGVGQRALWASSTASSRADVLGLRLRHAREHSSLASRGSAATSWCRYNRAVTRSRARRTNRVAFTDHWALRETMVFERRYHWGLAMSLADKRDLLRERGAIAVWMYEPGRRRRLIGESYGVPVEAVLREEDDEGTADLRPFAKRKALYVYSTTILERLEDHGLGKILKAYLLGRAFEAGYRWVVGHAREGGSVALNLRFGAELRQRHRNWYGTGEAYRFYVLKLR
jgi:hypothetical protein